MNSRCLLDCTLRDGGYVNDWNFGHEQMMEIFQRLVSTGVEFIEIGFLDESVEYDWNRSIQPNTASYDKIYENAQKNNATVLAMIDYGKCGLYHLSPANESFIDGIRVIFKEHLRDEALAFCAEVKALGYKVFAQMVSVTTYTDEALIEYADKVNEVMPYATSMVDTYGLLDEDYLLHIFSILDSHLATQIKVGYHAHNNLQLGFANACAFLRCGTEREILVDGTLYGMGKSAGNAPLELLLMYMDENQERHYVVNQALEAIDNVILPIYRKHYWGYNLFFYVSAATKCHPNYVKYFMNKRTLSVNRITELLGTLESSKRLIYDVQYAEQKYIEYQSVACDDANTLARLKEMLCCSTLLLLGPGINMERQLTRIQAFITKNRPLVISVNFVPEDVRIDAVFLTKSKRYTQMMDAKHRGINREAEIIATSNVTRTAGGFQYVVNYERLIDKSTEISDNSLVMLLRLLTEAGVREVSLAGFDGYSKTDDNYFDQAFEYSFSKEKADYFNEYVKNYLVSVEDKLQVRFVTDSYYQR